MDEVKLIKRAIMRYKKEYGTENGEPLRELCELDGNYIWLYGAEGELLQIYSGAEHNYLRVARFSASALRTRGWTARMIERLLGEPDDHAINQYHRTGPRVPLYDQLRVETVETTEDFAELLAQAERRRKKPDPLAPTIENITQALWEINKEAKRRRDAARLMYQQGRYGLASHRRTEKEEAYALKELALRQAAQQGMALIRAYHRVGDSVFACWEVGGLQFHEPLDEAPTDAQVEPLPDGWESLAAPVGTKMPLGVARATLRHWLGIGEQSAQSIRHPLNPPPTAMSDGDR